MSIRPRIAVLTPGEPAGVGPELACQLACDGICDWVAVADPALLESRASQLGYPVSVVPVTDWDHVPAPKQGQLLCWPVDLTEPAMAGTLNPANAPYVVESLRIAAKACLDGHASALITGPVHKGVINEAGIAFTGHTEYLKDHAGVDAVVMMLQAPMHQFDDWPLRVALVTTHLPLSAVAKSITSQRLTQTLKITHQALHQAFGLAEPHLLVLGLNPHAGEGGHLGREEIEIIEPVLALLRGQGMHLTGPLPADTAFLPDKLQTVDAVVAMYHDQGLPVLKHVGFGQAVNITLGLPYIRTSVDHGTALDIAGQGVADVGSLRAALNMARLMHRPRD